MLHPNPWVQAVALVTCVLAAAHCGGVPEKSEPTRDSPEVAIPSGEFYMGGRPGDVADLPAGDSIVYQAERPLHRVRISGFYMDEYEVTVGQYRAFLASLSATGDISANLHPDQPPEVDHSRGRTGDYLADDQPVRGASWFSAYAYCKWAGKRLPTEAEWEYAARGNDGVYRKYPWGNNGVHWEQIWFANLRSDADGHPGAAPVGSYPDGVSYFGVLDLAGNTSEWVQDWYSPDYYQTVPAGATDPQGPVTGDARVVKGGGYQSHWHDVRSAARGFGAPHESDRIRGFRCARDAE